VSDPDLYRAILAESCRRSPYFQSPAPDPPKREPEDEREREALTKRLYFNDREYTLKARRA
jgi:hypothetical protein